jgi:hypothetical protein
MEETAIYVLPSEEGMPARAILSPVDPDDPELEVGKAIRGTLATWTADMGTWTVGGTPVPQELAGAISAHAASLGVPGFADGS